MPHPDRSILGSRFRLSGSVLETATAQDVDENGHQRMVGSEGFEKTEHLEIRPTDPSYTKICHKVNDYESLLLNK
jgi:hypothetical protein